MSMTVLLAPPEPLPQEKLQSSVDWWRVALYANCAALLAVALFFRLWQLARVPGINGDEAWCGVVAVQILRGEPITWRTPTGNPLNPFFFGPQVLLHACFAPSYTLLRLPAVLSGITAVAVNYWLARKAFGKSAALISSLMLAVLPVNIAYSRFAWDACQSVLAVTLAMHSAVLAVMDRRYSGRWTLVAVGSLAGAVIVHPTNVFIAPLTCVLLGYRWRAEIISALHWLRTGRHKLATAVIVTTSSIGLLWLELPWVERALAWAGQLGGPADFFRLYARLFSGATVYEFVSGAYTADAPTLALTGKWLDIAFWSQALLLGYGVRRRMLDRPSAAERLVLLGYATSVFGFYFVAGPQALAPHFERYGMCLIAPACLLGALGAEWWLRRGTVNARIVLTSLIAVAWLMLGSFYFDYFRFIEHTGGQSHHTFRTSTSDPKLLALEHVVASRTPNTKCTILTGEWWSYWPVQYCALSEPQIDVVHWRDVNALSGSQTSTVAQEIWCIEFTGSPKHDQIRQLLIQARHAFSEFEIHDNAGRPVLSVVGPLSAVVFQQAELPNRDNSAFFRTGCDSSSYPENIFCENLTRPKADLVFSREVCSGASHPGDGENQSGFRRKFPSSRIHGENDSSLAKWAASAERPVASSSSKGQTGRKAGTQSQGPTGNTRR